MASTPGAAEGLVQPPSRRPLESHALWALDDDDACPLHDAGLAALGLERRTERQPASSNTLHALLDEAERACSGVLIGASLAGAVAERYAGNLDETAARASAVDLLRFSAQGRPTGSLLGVAALVEAWRRGAIFIRGRSAALVGAGGSARTTIIALAEAAAEEVTVHGSSAEAEPALLALARREGLRASAEEGPPAQVAIFAEPPPGEAAEWIGQSLSAPGVVHDLRLGRRAAPLRNPALRGGHLFVDGSSMVLARCRAQLEALRGGGPLPSPAARAMERALAAALR